VKVSIIAKQWSDMMPIKHIMKQCPVTTLSTDDFLYSDDDNMVSWLRDVAVKALTDGTESTLRRLSFSQQLHCSRIPPTAVDTFSHSCCIHNFPY